MPDGAATPAIQRKHLVWPRDVHHAIHYHGSHFEREMINWEDPLDSQCVHVPGRYLV